MWRSIAVLIAAVLLTSALVTGVRSGALAAGETPIGGAWPTGEINGYWPIPVPITGSANIVGEIVNLGPMDRVTAGIPLATAEEAREAFADYLNGRGNADLVVVDVLRFERDYYGVVRESGSGNAAFELLADQKTGAVTRDFGPSTVWNTTYGVFAGSASGPLGLWPPPVVALPASVSAEQARSLAAQWMLAHAPGSVPGSVVAFPGYYTLQVTQFGRTTGLLSVNTATGQVWMHQWHGALRGSDDAEG